MAAIQVMGIPMINDNAPDVVPNGDENGGHGVGHVIGLQIEEQLPKRAVFERKRHLWNSQYPVVLRPIPSWLTRLLQRVQTELFSPITVDKGGGAGTESGNAEREESGREEIDQVQYERMMVMTRLPLL